MAGAPLIPNCVFCDLPAVAVEWNNSNDYLRFKHYKHGQEIVCASIDSDVVRIGRKLIALREKINNGTAHFDFRSHSLKTWKHFFQDVIEGKKTFEARANDRDFRVGDQLVLNEYDHEKCEMTGRSCVARITYMMTHEQFPNGIQPGYVVLAMELED